MNSIINLLKFIDYPIWIKDESDEIIFMNESFKYNFINKEFIKVNGILNKIQSLNENATEVIKFNGMYYKPLILPNIEEKNIIGILINITDEIQNYSLYAQKSILQTIIDEAQEMVFYKDKNLRYIGMNKQFKKFYEDMGVTSILGKTDLDLPIDKSFAKKYEKHDISVINKKECFYMEEVVDGNILETIKKPIISLDGDIEGLVGIVKNATCYKRKEKISKKLCYTDALTDLFNRTYFNEKVHDLINEKKYPIGVILGDINELKLVNDTLGHKEGDKLIKKMSKILVKCCKNTGTVFRWGGDEFIILLPECTDLQCTELMKEINYACNETIYENINLRISQGYAILEEGSSIDKVVAEAEDKVYRQKIFSENTVRVSILDNLKSNLASKNIETEKHTERVSNYCVEICKALDLDEYMLEKAALVGKLHDIGKIGIADHILLKPGRLTAEEYEHMKTHSEKGHRLASLIPEVSHISREILTHHERWDGKGYPLGLQGEEIPILSRVVSIADSFDAMIEDRCYSKGRSIEEAIEEIKKCSGTQFDPDIVNIFIEIIDKIRELSL